MTAAVVFGCAGRVLGNDERSFFRDLDPLGFILFARNVESPDQVRRLVDDLRGTVSRADAPVLIDQEGGRVQRLGPPCWAVRPAMRRFGEGMRHDPEEALRCAELNARLIASDLAALGIDVNCAPILDLPAPGGHEVIGDRAFSDEPETVARMGRAFCRGLTSGGVVPVVKHLPGHGRAMSDSHRELPRVDAPLDLLAETDFAPFAALSGAAAGMTAHVAYEAIDPGCAGSVSEAVIGGIVRSQIGFDGLLFSDDVCMNALVGEPAARIEAVLQAGCDVALHCNGDFESMLAAAAGCPEMAPGAGERLQRARAATSFEGFDRQAAQRRVDEFLRVGQNRRGGYSHGRPGITIREQ